MTVTQILASFVRDTQVHAVGVLITADVIFGVLAALKTNTFALSHVVDTLHDDVLAKVLPWLALFAFGKVSASSLVGVDFGNVADVFFGGICLAMGASILKSLADLGVKGVPPALDGGSKP